MKIMKFGLKWVHMLRRELILKLDGALWLRIIHLIYEIGSEMGPYASA